MKSKGQKVSEETNRKLRQSHQLFPVYKTSHYQANYAIQIQFYVKNNVSSVHT